MDITSLIRGILGVCTAVCTAFVIPYLKSKISSERLEKALKFIKIAVASAEQIYDATEGAKKKQYVVDTLALNGVSIDGFSIDEAIESAVLELHNALKE